MDLRNCRRCGRIFAYSVKPICPNCVQQEEEEFETVRSYLKENPGSTINKISKDTHVSSKQIIKFFQEGRLEILDGMLPLIVCEKCGKAIFTGKFCHECANDLHKQFEGAVKSRTSQNSADESSTVGMHLSKFRKEG